MSSDVKESIHAYMSRMVNTIAQDELSNEKLPKSLREIVAISNVYSKDDVLNELVSRIQVRIGDALKDPLVQEQLKKEAYPPEHPETFYTFQVVEKVRTSLADWQFPKKGNFLKGLFCKIL